MPNFKRKGGAGRGGLAPRAIIEKLTRMQMIDVELPTTDGRTVVLSRYTEPDRDLALLLKKLGIGLPEQSPPKISHDTKTVTV